MIKLFVSYKSNRGIPEKLCTYFEELNIISIHVSGCNIGSKSVLAEQGKLPLRLTCPVGTSTCPNTQLHKGKLYCKDST